MSNLAKAIAEVLAKKFAGKEALREIGERLKAMQERLLSPEQLAVFERLAKHVDEIDPPAVTYHKLKTAERGGSETTAPFYEYSGTDNIVFMKGGSVPERVDTTDYSQDGDGSILGWIDGDTLRVAPKAENAVIEVDFAWSLFRKSTVKTVDVSEVYFSAENIQSMFYDCHELTKVTGLKAPNGKIFSSTFQNCTSLTETQEIEMPKAEKVNSMYNGCTSLQTAGDMVFPNVNTGNTIFKGCSSLRTAGRIDMPLSGPCQEIFQNCGQLQTVGEINIPNAGNANNIFNGCTSLTGDLSVNLGENFTTLNYTFANCNEISSIKITGNGKNLTSLIQTFEACWPLKEIDISFINPNDRVAESLNVKGTFQFDGSLKTIYGYDLTGIPGVLDSYNTFTTCTNLPGFKDGADSGEYCKLVADGGYFTDPSEKQ